MPLNTVLSVRYRNYWGQDETDSYVVSILCESLQRGGIHIQTTYTIRERTL